MEKVSGGIEHLLIWLSSREMRSIPAGQPYSMRRDVMGKDIHPADIEENIVLDFFRYEAGRKIRCRLTYEVREKNRMAYVYYEKRNRFWREKKTMLLKDFLKGKWLTFGSVSIAPDPSLRELVPMQRLKLNENLV